MKLSFNLRIILLLLCLVYIFSYFDSLSDYEKIADRITGNTAKELKAQKHLCLVGTGGQMMNDIQMMAMSFDYYQEVDLKTGRELIVPVINQYLSAINNNKEIRPYLHEYPFTAKNVEIRIFIYNPDRSELPPEKIDCITSLDGTLKYYTRSNPHQAIYEESYEKAVQELALNEGFIEKVGQSTDRKCSEKTMISKIAAKDGAKVNINVTSLEYSIFELNGEGFKPNEALNVISNSCQEAIHFQVTADKNGNILPVGLLPAVIGKSGGVCHIDILREEESIHIKFPWGTETESVSPSIGLSLQSRYDKCEGILAYFLCTDYTKV